MLLYRCTATYLSAHARHGVASLHSLSCSRALQPSQESCGTVVLQVRMLQRREAALQQQLGAAHSEQQAAQRQAEEAAHHQQVAEGRWSGKPRGPQALGLCCIAPRRKRLRR